MILLLYLIMLVLAAIVSFSHSLLIQLTAYYGGLLLLNQSFAAIA
jgi:hypothetical protein